MKRFRYGDYVNGDVAETGDESLLHCGFSRITCCKSIFKLI